uniref:Uncharacterized protein n=1 Tax=Arabidopsis thaliana TaxID=3702 RepID=Q0WQM9_ARATH|nr:hypothetical protein [Arabidopsis thaliana]
MILVRHKNPLTNQTCPNSPLLSPMAQSTCPCSCISCRRNPNNPQPQSNNPPLSCRQALVGHCCDVALAPRRARNALGLMTCLRSLCTP